MAQAEPDPLRLELLVTHDGSQIAGAVARGFDWTIEQGSKEGEIAAGDVACTIPTHEITPLLFRFCTTREPIDEVDVFIRMTNNSRGGGYKMQDVLVSSFRTHDGGGIVGLEAGLTTLTFNWRSVEVSYRFSAETYTKKD